MTYRHPYAAVRFDIAAGRLLRGPEKKNIFYTLHIEQKGNPILVGQPKLLPEMTADAKYRKFAEIDIIRMINLRENGTITLRDWDSHELAVAMPQGQYGIFPIHYEISGYLPYIASRKGFISEPDISLIAACAIMVTADGKMLFQHRSGKVGVAQGKIGVAASGNVVLEDAVDGRLEPRIAAAREIKEEVGIEVDWRDIAFIGIAQDNAVSNNLLLAYSVNVNMGAEEIEAKRRQGAQEGAWEVKDMDYVPLGGIPVYLGQNFGSMIPESLFGGLLVCWFHFGEPAFDAVMKTVKEVAQKADAIRQA